MSLKKLENQVAQRRTEQMKAVLELCNTPKLRDFAKLLCEWYEPEPDIVLIIREAKNAGLGK